MSAAPSVAPYKLASVLLAYPTEALFAGLDQLRAAVGGVTPKGSRRPLERFLDYLGSTEPAEVAQHYVATFDLRRRCALYLTYYRHGDTRKRGMALLAFKSAYRAAGFTPSTEELPDYLPMVLDFAAHAGEGERLLRTHRADLELLRRALAAAETPYVDLVEAVAARLPRLGRRDLGVVAKAWEAGPPREDVGLEPFAPPEYLTGEPGRR